VAPIVFITGPPGSGKSTVGRALAELLKPQSAHLKVDDLREIMVNGFAPPGDWTAEAEAQFQRARQLATAVAMRHAAEGVAFVIDDVCIPGHFPDHYGDLFAEPRVTRVLLNPSRSALEARIRARGAPWDQFFLESDALDWTYSQLAVVPLDGWLVIDSSQQSITETTIAVLNALTPGA
jgi:predicted kinase